MGEVVPTTFLAGDELRLQLKADEYAGAGRCTVALRADRSEKAEHVAVVMTGGAVRFEVDRFDGAGTERDAAAVERVLEPLLKKGRA